MGAATVLDIVLVLVVAGYAAAMYRVGLMAGALSMAGFLGGGLLALWLLPDLLRRWSQTADQVVLQGLLCAAGVLVAAGLGARIGGFVGRRLRALVRVRPARIVDSLLGAVASVVVTATLLWFVAGAVHASLPPAASRAVGHSRVLAGIGAVMPSAADQAFTGALRVLDEHGFPRVFTGLSPEPILPVRPPEPGVVDGRGIEAAAASVVKVTGLARACGQVQEGSGWVAAPQRVVTNAHVVAGVTHPMVQPGGTGRSYRATTVVFDPNRDLAVLAVPGLQARALPTGAALTHGDSAVVAGYPGDGPYDVEAARVRAQLNAFGADIYGNSGVERRVYSLNTKVRPGNSGGPLLSPTGQVVGTVFARSVDDPRTGYALTLAESRPLVARAAWANQPVSTGACTNG